MSKESFNVFHLPPTQEKPEICVGFGQIFGVAENIQDPHCWHASFDLHALRIPKPGCKLGDLII